MRQYHKLLKHVLENGTDKNDRTGTGTRSVFGMNGLMRMVNWDLFMGSNGDHGLVEMERQ